MHQKPLWFFCRAKQNGFLESLLVLALKDVAKHCC